jgi:UDP:flavonoid glycosyltransferase YjiC (YdhE family)
LNNLEDRNSIKISFIVCSNGFGHFKRVLGVAQALIEANKNCEITIFCSNKYIDLINNVQPNFRIDSDKNIRFNKSISRFEINFLKIKAGSYSKYQKWVQVIAANKKLIESNLIVSDNQIAPLNAFNNVILMGSFIWHDLIKSSVLDYKMIIALEKKILKAYEPKILCLRSMAMDNLSKNTIPVFAPWFTEKYESRFSSKDNSVLITGGGTSLFDDVLIQILNYLLTLDEQLIIHLDSKLFNKYSSPNDRVKLFSFKDDDFCRLKAIICRPGIGILTDCVKYNIPVIALNDNSNLEISSNALNVERLELGVLINIKKSYYLNPSTQIITLLNNNSALENFRMTIEKQECNGSRFAANYLLSQCIKL